jgi:hypothetical protein
MRLIVAALAIAGAAAITACGSSSSDEELSGPAVPSNPAAFHWLRPATPAGGWQSKDLPSGKATLAYPPGWKLTRTDPGTVTAARVEEGQIVGYLNVTPQQGDESLADWASFRPAHNQEEGDHDLVPIASATGVRFRDGHASCVKDSYVTGSDHPYTEIACIVQGPSSTNVIVGAAPPDRWGELSGQLERSISSSSFT